MDRRLSCNSDSSLEPMDISKTSSSSLNNTTSTSNNSSGASLLPLMFHPGQQDLFAPPQRRPAESRRRRCTEDDNEHEEDDDDAPGDGGHLRRDNLRKKYRHVKNSNGNNGADYDDDEDEDGGIDLRRVKSEANSAEDLSASAPMTGAQQPNAHMLAHQQPHHQHNSRVPGQTSVQPASQQQQQQQYTCPICEHVSGTQHDFTEHIRTHNNVSEDGQHYVCRICDKVLSSSSSLDRHVLVHTGERPFNCKYCHLTFTTNGNMHRHIRTHQQRGDIPALTNNNTTNSQNHNAANGNSRHHANNNNYHPVPQQMHHQQQQQQQQLHHHQQQQNNHHHNHQANLNDTDSDAASSDSCRSPSNNNTHSQNNHNHHQQQHPGNNFNKRKHSYDDTNATLAGNEAKRPHKTTINNNHIIDGALEADAHLTCPVCGRSEFVSMPQLDAHMDREHPGIQAKCRGCEALFKSHKARSAHKCPVNANVVHGFKDLTYIDFSADKFPLIARTICENPVRMAIGTPRFECRKCPRAFPCASALDIHARSCDGFVGSPPSLKTLPHDFSARSRNMSETSEEDARRDDFFAHLDLKNKAAASEQSAFSPVSQMDTSYGSMDKSSPSLLAMHIKREQQTTPGPIASTTPNPMQNFHASRLPVRSGPFDMGKDLADIQSMINVSANGVGFMHQHQHLFDPMQRSPLMGHLPMTPKEQQSGGSVTSGCDRREEPEEAQDAEFTAEFRKMKLRGEFPCKLCPAVFPNLRALKGHNRIHVSESGAGPYRCNMCSYSIHDKQALVRHMRTHNGDRPYECAICNYAFTTKANCERHLRNRHAKTTRDEVKRAIIYHPSEDSSCDDPVKKMQIYNASYDDVVTGGNTTMTADDLISPKCMRSVTPLSHLKEILTPPSEKSVKIQVKSIDQLTRSQQQPELDEVPQRLQVNRAMDFSADDALDLSKKSDTPKSFADEQDHVSNNGQDHVSNNGHDYSHSEEDKANDRSSSHLAAQQAAAGVPSLPPAMPQLADLALKSHPLLFPQPLLNDIDPAHYLQLSQFYRNLIFPGGNFGLHPAMFLPPAFLPPGDNVEAAAAAAMFAGLPPPPPMPSAFGPSAIPSQQSPAQAAVAPAPPAPASPFKREPMAASSPQPQHLHPQLSHTPQQQQQQHRSDSPHRPLSMPTQQELTHRMQSLHAAAAAHSPLAANNGPNAMHQFQQQQQHHHHMQHMQQQQQHPSPQPSITNTGPVKMVIKNGVLMPKQKQRRYRTERPFACEHCSARFTLRSNMERHIKQQHPQYWAQRQRGSVGPSAQMAQHQPQPPQQHQQMNGNGGLPLMPSQMISDQVKYAILAQQLKSRNNAPTASDSSKIPQVGDLESFFPHHLQPQQQLDQQQRYDETANEYYAQMRERERELQMQKQMRSAAGDEPADYDRSIDEDNEDEDDDEEDDDNGSELVIDEDSEPEDLSALTKTPPPVVAMIGQSVASAEAENSTASTGDLVPVSKLIDNASIPFGGYFPTAPAKTSEGVAPSAVAVVNVAVAIDHSDEEGLVASGSSASESNNSGAEENGGRVSTASRRRMRSPSSSSSSGVASSGANKKKSAYSLAPNRVSCPYCQRMFPWTSSLRRHILTHTGQKPFKCSHCPLLFTTKSNCDRHLLRKHGDVESAQSLYVPLEDVADSALTGRMIVMADRDEDDERDDDDQPMPQKIVEPICSVEMADDDEDEDENEDEDEDDDEDDDEAHAVKPEVLNCIETELASNDADGVEQPPSPEHTGIDASAVLASSTPKPTDSGAALAAINSELLPFKCHLCDGSFADRISCLDHIKLVHAQDFELLLAKGAIDTDVSSDPQHTMSAEDDDQQQQAAHQHQQQQGGKSGGKYPDYANRKVMCAFCMRRFWSTEDLRRHMRTHSGERPFQCQICQRRFTLKHSMLRHQKKHAHRQHHNQQQQSLQHLQQQQPHNNGPQTANSASESDDDTRSGTTPPPPQQTQQQVAPNGPRAKIMPELIPKELSWKFQLDHGENLVAALQKAHFFRAAAAAAAAAQSTGGGDVANAAEVAHHSATSDLIGNLLGISDQSMLSQVLRSSADEAAKLLGVDK